MFFIKRSLVIKSFNNKYGTDIGGHNNLILKRMVYAINPDVLNKVFRKRKFRKMFQTAVKFQNKGGGNADKAETYRPISSIPTIVGISYLKERCML